MHLTSSMQIAIAELGRFEVVDRVTAKQIALLGALSKIATFTL